MKLVAFQIYRPDWSIWRTLKSTIIILSSGSGPICKYFGTVAANHLTNSG